MKRYLVGGAVRDRLLGLPVKDRDWVVVGASVEEMLDAGYQPIGKDFPVFLHPETKEEYALARTERKTARGYHGFSFHASPEVTLEEDLARRDLTLNAIAEDSNGLLLDPFNGESDIKNRTLRHVSSAFSEDPVRILRAARLRARFADKQFSIAASTMSLMRSMVDNGEASALVAERVWQETDKALNTQQPRVYFETLRECGALAVVFPEIDRLFGVPQPPQWHPEIDTGLHTMLVLDQVCALTTDNATRFAVLCHDLGKAETDPKLWPSHHGHEKVSAELTKTLCQRLRVPRDYQSLGVLLARFHTHAHKALELKATTLTKTLASLDVLRKPDRFRQFLIACEADARGRTGFENTDYPQAEFMQAAADAFLQVDAAALAETTSSPELIGDTIYRARVSAVKDFLTRQKK